MRPPQPLNPDLWWRKFWRPYLNRKIQDKTRLFPIEERRPEDILIVGFPRSGHTWMQNLVASLVFGINPAVAPDALVQEVVPDIYAARYYRRYREPMLFKSHEMPDPDYRNVIYLIRDGRDVAVSFYHFLKKDGVANYEAKFRSRFMPRAYSWAEHVRAWLDNPHQARLHLIRYENLLGAPVEEMRRLCQFIGLERTEAAYQETVVNCAFDKLQAKERREGLSIEKWPKDQAFFRRGKKGSYKDEFPPEELAQFEKEAGPLLRELGYTA